MNITLTGTKITQDNKFLAFEKNNGVDVINITVDTDESWSYKLDVKYPEKCCTGEELYNIIDLNRDGDICSVELTSKMLPFAGKYTMQLRAINGDKVKHSDTFDAWIKYSIEPASTYDPVPSEFYQIEQNVTEMNNHPPKPGQNGYWLVWDITTSQYKESDIPLPDGMLPEVTADTSGKYLSNDGKKAYWVEVQTGTESKIDKIEVNGVEQPIVDKTVNIAVPTKTSDLSNDSGYITNEALDGYATKAELPTKVSQLENDSKFINESALDGYAKTDDIPTKTSQLNNDSGYITANDVPVKSVDGATGDVVTNAVKTTAQTLTDAQKQQARANIGAGTSSFNGDYNSLTNKPTIPIKTSQLTNDSGFITNAALTGYAKTTDIPTKTSQLDNDSHYITASEAPVQSVNGQTGAVELTAEDVGAIADETDPTVPDWAKQPTKPSYTAEEVGADPSGTAAAQVAAHNSGTDTHSDIRVLIQGLTDRLNALADSDDTTLDQLSEVVSYIKSNRTLIEAITTSKVSVADIVDNLATNVTNKPLSAAQGVALKELIDALSNSMTAYRTAAVQDVIDSGKVDKVTGKGLSSNDYTDAAKAKVDALAPVATSGSYDDLTNKPTIPTAYDDTEVRQRIGAIEAKESTWDAKSNFSGSYNDLTDKPAIPDAVTEGTVSGWGFTKNTGTYSKPTGGIPKTDLANDVQASLGKADTALQKHQSLAAYRTAAAQDIIDNGKQDKITSTNKLAYSLISGTPTIPTVPTKVSAFTNDAGYLTLATLPKYEGVVE